jgi:hypothetical protein
MCNKWKPTKEKGPFERKNSVVENRLKILHWKKEFSFNGRKGSPGNYRK